MPQQRDYCFATLALGRMYRFYARQLAVDLTYFAPQVPFVILTDRTQDFISHENVVAVEHKQQSILRCYHDKRFVIQRALSDFDLCVFIDADCRIVEPLPEALPRILGEGVNAFYTEPIREKYASDICDEAGVQRKRAISAAAEWEMVQNAAKEFNVDLDRVTFVREVIFSVRRDSRHEQFVSHWGNLARHFELRGLSRAEGVAIGMAASLVGWPIVSHQFLAPTSFYNDHVVGRALSSGREVHRSLQHCHAQRLLFESLDRPFKLFKQVRNLIVRAQMLSRWFRARFVTHFRSVTRPHNEIS